MDAASIHRRRSFALVLPTIALAGLTAAPARAQVNLPEGFEIVTFDRSPTLKTSPRMNICGQIIYHERDGDWDIMLHDNGRTINATDNDDWDGIAEINDRGDMILSRGEGDNEPTKLYLRIDGQEILFDENVETFGSAAINDRRHVAWVRDIARECPSIRSAVFFWDGQRSVQISPDDLYHQGVDLNEFDQISYMRTDFCTRPWAGDIRLYSNGQTVILPTQETFPVGTHVNDRGHVLWNTDRGYEIWNGRRTKLLAGGDTGGGNINNNGDVYFTRWEVDRDNWQPWLSRWTPDGRVLLRLADDNGRHTDGDVNDWGEVVWTWWDSVQHTDTAIYLMQRIRTGDAEFDGDIDLADAGAFVDCITGPGRVDRLCDCRFLDLDHDGDVDLGDFARFQNAFGAR